MLEEEGRLEILRSALERMMRCELGDIRCGLTCLLYSNFDLQGIKMIDLGEIVMSLFGPSATQCNALFTCLAR